MRVTVIFMSQSLLDLTLQLLKQPAFNFPYLSAAQAGDVNVIARTMAFVIVLVAADVEQVKLVNQAEPLEHIQSAVDGDAVNAGIDFLGAIENGAGVQMLLGVIHHFEEDAALASDANPALGESGLKTARHAHGRSNFRHLKRAERERGACSGLNCAYSFR